MRRLLFVFLVLILAFSNLSCIQQNLTDDEKKLLFTVHNVLDYTASNFQEIQKCESFSKITLLNLYTQYGYSFDSSKEKGNTSYLYINSKLASYFTVSAAKENLKSQYNGFKIGLKVAGMTTTKVGLKEANHLFTLGDQNYHSFIKKRDSVIGNFIITRLGKRVVEIILIGIYFDEKDLLEECVGETIKNIKKYK